MGLIFMFSVDSSPNLLNLLLHCDRTYNGKAEYVLRKYQKMSYTVEEWYNRGWGVMRLLRVFLGDF